MPEASPERRRLQRRMGDVLELCGRGEAAAHAYLEAAAGAAEGERVDLERAAAAQLLSCGHIDQGADILRRVLAVCGLNATQSPIAALVSLIGFRLWLLVVGLTFRERPAAEITPQERVRLEALFAAALGLAIVDVVPAMATKTRYLIEALRTGDRAHVIRASVLESSNLATLGGVPGNRERALVTLCRGLAEPAPLSADHAFQEAVRGVSSFLRGRWREAHDLLDGAYRNSPLLRTGWQTNASLFATYCLCFLGELREAERRRDHLLAEADARGDLYTVVNLRASVPTMLWLAAADPATAQREVTESMARWSRSRFLVQHWQAMYAETEIALYRGEGTEAYDRMARDRRALKGSFLLNVQFIRAQTLFARGRSLVASAPQEGRAKRARLRQAMGVSAKLERERMPWTSTLAAMVAAAAAHAAGSEGAAIASLRAAVAHAQACDMPLYAAAAQRGLGKQLGGDEGGALVIAADRAMAAQGVRAPGAFTRMLLPGLSR